jgi:hypothetical protein
VAELQRAAEEIKFGVRRVGKVAQTVGTPLVAPGATVEVELIENRTIKIKLTLTGYKVRLSPCLSTITMTPVGSVGSGCS